ncbi:MAG: DUF5067 domain-containing protein [Coriobacteriia bacterium]|nr:DUF5067 domain-containing protein [Coriobacteriia bacterium]
MLEVLIQRRQTVNMFAHIKEDTLKRLLMLLLALMLVLSVGVLTACDEPEEVIEEPPVAVDPVDPPEDYDAQDGDATFENSVFSTPEMTIEITSHRVIQPGDEGNDFGDEPVIAFWYEVTNHTDDDLNPTTAWIMTMSAFQDNDPNMDNELDVTIHPDSDLVGNQSANIREGGTVENAVAYTLTDEVTPVELVASLDLGFTTVGSMLFNVE